MLATLDITCVSCEGDSWHGKDLLDVHPERTSSDKFDVTKTRSEQHSYRAEVLPQSAYIDVNYVAQQQGSMLRNLKWR